MEDHSEDRMEVPKEDRMEVPKGDRWVDQRADQRADLQDRSVMEAELILFVRRVLAPKQVRALPPQLAVVEG